METKEKTLLRLRLRLDPETAFVGTPATTQRTTAARFVQLDIIIIIIMETLFVFLNVQL